MEEGLILDHSFRGFIPWLLDLSPWACIEAKHLGKEYVVEQICTPHGNQDAEKEKGLGQDISCKGMPPVTYFLQYVAIS
jgi:hypothetical protein